MPVLTNARHERFAQELATGTSAIKAYQLAGFQANYGNCIRLKGNERVLARVTELQAVAARKTEVPIESLVDEFDEARNIALERGQASAAVAATMGKARVTGKLVERIEVDGASEFESMSQRELQAYLIEGLAEQIRRDEVFREMIAQELRPVLNLLTGPVGLIEHE